MIWQMTWGLIALGILSLAIFVWRMTRRARLLDLSDIVLLGFGIWALLEGLSELFGAAH